MGFSGKEQEWDTRLSAEGCSDRDGPSYVSAALAAGFPLNYPEAAVVVEDNIYQKYIKFYVV